MDRIVEMDRKKVEALDKKEKERSPKKKNLNTWLIFVFWSLWCCCFFVGLKNDQTPTTPHPPPPLPQKRKKGLE